MSELDALKDRIFAFCDSKQRQEMILGMIKAGRDADHSPLEIAKRIMGYVLLEFNGIPYQKTGKN